MCVKHPPENLNPGPYPPHFTSIYIYGVTIKPRVRGCNTREYIKQAHITPFFLVLITN